jgi:KDO2-lipid IV(A) lauroyltransferase
MRKFHWWIEYLIYKLFTLPFIYSPSVLRKFVGKSLAILFYYISPRHRKVTLKNLEIAFPEKGKKWRLKTAKNCYRFFGKMIADIIAFNRLKPQGLRKLIYKIEGEQYFKEAYDDGKGILVMASHFGNWEFLSLGASAAGYKVAVIARYSDNPLLEKELHRCRTTSGGVVIYKKNAIKNMIRYIKSGFLIGFLADQNQIAQEGVFVDFFGKKASATPTLAMMSLKYNIPIIPSYCIPEGKKKYKLVFEAPIEIKKSGNYKKDIQDLTQKCSLYLENLIKKYPEYWLWMHKKWNTRPAGEKPIY